MIFPRNTKENVIGKVERTASSKGAGSPQTRPRNSVPHGNHTKSQNTRFALLGLPKSQDHVQGIHGFVQLRAAAQCERMPGDSTKCGCSGRKFKRAVLRCAGIVPTAPHTMAPTLLGRIASTSLLEQKLAKWPLRIDDPDHLGSNCAEDAKEPVWIVRTPNNVDFEVCLARYRAGAFLSRLSKDLENCGHRTRHDSDGTLVDLDIVEDYNLGSQEARRD